MTHHCPLQVNMLVTEMKSEALKERHWKQLMKNLRVRWQLHDLTLGQVWAVDLVRNEMVVKDVILVAQGEMALEEFLKMVCVCVGVQGFVQGLFGDLARVDEGEGVSSLQLPYIVRCSASHNCMISQVPITLSKILDVLAHVVLLFILWVLCCQ